MTAAQAPLPRPSTPEPDDGLTLTNRWPWRTSEYVSTAITAAFVAFIGTLIHRNSPGNDATWSAGILATSALTVLWLWHVKTSRVKKSAIHLTINDTRISVYQDGPVGSSAVDVAHAKTIVMRKFGSDECFVVSDGTKAARIPLRTTRHPEVARLLVDAFGVADSVDPDAVHLYRTVPGYE